MFLSVLCVRGVMGRALSVCMCEDSHMCLCCV